MDYDYTCGESCPHYDAFNQTCWVFTSERFGKTVKPGDECCQEFFDVICPEVVPLDDTEMIESKLNKVVGVFR